MIEEIGYEVDQATRGAIALQLFRERIELVLSGKAEMYKIIFLDYSMPEMDGP